MNTAEIAAAILEIIPDEKHWVKGAARMGDRRCVLDALTCVPARHQERRNFISAFRCQASELYPRISAVQVDVPAFNDHPDVTYTEIRTVLEKMRAG